MDSDQSLHLRSIDVTLPDGAAGFPYDVPVVANWERLEFASPVTFFVGENGSGKSTILEAVAAAADMITVGGKDIRRDETLKHIQALSRSVRLSWSKRTRKGFFLRAEDYFGFVKRQAELRQSLQEDMEAVDTEYEGRSEYAKGLAKSTYAGSLSALQNRYGDGLDHYSHGESFLTFFQSRFIPGGLYLLDEPETPLSPLRQLGLLSLIKEMVTQQAQFIIVSHSPILMAYPDAQLLNFDESPPKVVKYNDLEHVNLTRDFLNDPDQFLRRL